MWSGFESRQVPTTTIPGSLRLVFKGTRCWGQRRGSPQFECDRGPPCSKQTGCEACDEVVVDIRGLHAFLLSGLVSKAERAKYDNRFRDVLATIFSEAGAAT